MSQRLISALQNEPNKIDLLVHSCLSADYNYFFSLFDQICFEVNQNIYPTQTLQAKLLNQLYQLFPLFYRNLGFVLSTQESITPKIVSSFRLLRSLPLSCYIDKVISKSIQIVAQFYSSKTNTLGQLTQAIEPLASFFPSDFNEVLPLIYLKKCFPVMNELVTSDETFLICRDLQVLAYENTQLAKVILTHVKNVFVTFTLQASESLRFIFNTMRNLSIIDGSLELCDICLSEILKRTQLTVSDFLAFVENVKFQESCFEFQTSQNDEQKLFQPLDQKYYGKVPVKLVKAISVLFKNELFEEYEKRLVNRLINANSSELEMYNKTNTFLQKYVFDDNVENPCQVMFADVDRSLQEISRNAIFRPLVISKEYWPEQQDVFFKDCKEVTLWKEDSSKKFKELHTRQNITFKHLGNVSLRYTNLDGETTTHVVTPLQATVLIKVSKEHNGILVNELAHDMGVSANCITDAIAYWMDNKVITMTEYFGNFLLKKE
ncbi:hypothetical protein EIN_492530 [Entamoeba invadens IP1]|uniref:Cullin family profile domain-containing protein n=1 Tax=Entamoeba invadens IP1 TaxID=370355 RepID=A0A0A1UA25_ENTIV|nr:hypothetical protein EIN_492530 [Entamoeba invadens IP1]ELP88994.1 hypothetical protein EIN_492530 [Entamoeba invadens IP1]|eukprot:XP_004255765.1 hypothetical protein EIN_492530 [Entamoeba invadens IP1]